MECVKTGPLCDGGWVAVSVRGWYEANSSASVLRAAVLDTSSITLGGGGGGWFAKNWCGAGIGESGGTSLMIIAVGCYRDGR